MNRQIVDKNSKDSKMLLYPPCLLSFLSITLKELHPSLIKTSSNPKESLSLLSILSLYSCLQSKEHILDFILNPLKDNSMIIETQKMQIAF
jgi:DNA mismatch repair ATPase MutS